MTEGVVSVIVPVYNVEQFLDACIESVVAQTYQNLEIILVDDASPDRCPERCEAWAKRDARIKVIHKQNAGLGMARNTGLEHARGEYVCFVDSDDVVEPDMVACCYAAAKAHSADLVCFGHDRLMSDGSVTQAKVPNAPKSVFCGEEVQTRLLPMAICSDIRTGADWNVTLSSCFSMFSMALIRETGWRFVSEREILSEDFYSVFQFYRYVKTVALIDRVFYHYRVNLNSLSRSYRADRFEKTCHFYEKMKELSEQFETPSLYADALAGTFLSLTMAAMKQIAGADMKKREKLAQLRCLIRTKQLQAVLRTHDFSGENRKKKILYFCVRRKLTRTTYTVVCLRNLKD